MVQASQFDYMKVRCKSTGVYYVRTFGFGFITMDVNQATVFEDTPRLRAYFIRNYPYELEFIAA
jgi:hypothetical protein